MVGIFTSTIERTTQHSLDAIVGDDSYGSADTVTRKWMTQKTMKHAFVDIQEYGGMGLAAEKQAGGEMAKGTIYEGVATRVYSRVFALMAAVAEEAIEDEESALETIKAAKRLDRAIWLTLDTDTGLQLARGFNTGFTFGDSLPMFSASHPLPQTGTFSNIAPVAFTPSSTALIAHYVQARKFPAHDGIVTSMGYVIKKILCPVDQEPVWMTIINSEKTPGVFNEINIVNKAHSLMNLDVVGNPFWNNTTTNYALMTDVEGLYVYWKHKPKSRTWVSNETTSMNFAITGRWGRTMTDPRCILGVEA